MHQGAENLWDHWPRVKAALTNKVIFLFLDYDGTLTPIAERPELALLSKDTREVLEKLVKQEHLRVFVISGRALADVKKLVGIQHIEYIGNHGLEMEGGADAWRNFPVERNRQIMEYLKAQINTELNFFKGSFVEDKGIGLSVHYRLIDQEKESMLRIFLDRITREFVINKEIHVISGKKVFEIRPPLDWDKGKAVLSLLKAHQDAIDQNGAVIIYMGDDQTDETAFKALGSIATTIHIGDSPSTAANYRLENPQEVTKFLRHLVDLKGQKG